jgi:hypothetical protein
VSRSKQNSPTRRAPRTPPYPRRTVACARLRASGPLPAVHAWAHGVARALCSNRSVPQRPFVAGKHRGGTLDDRDWSQAGTPRSRWAAPCQRGCPAPGGCHPRVTGIAGRVGAYVCCFAGVLEHHFGKKCVSPKRTLKPGASVPPASPLRGGGAYSGSPILHASRTCPYRGATYAQLVAVHWYTLWGTH